MRALRFLKGTKGEMDIWKEWLRVEVGFAERMRARWELLGIGKGELVQTKKVVEDVGMDVDGDEDEGDAEVELPQARTEDSLLDKTANEVATKALSGQEAILDGAIVRVVLDNTLSCTSPVLLRDMTRTDIHCSLLPLARSACCPHQPPPRPPFRPPTPSPRPHLRLAGASPPDRLLWLCIGRPLAFDSTVIRRRVRFERAACRGSRGRGTLDQGRGRGARRRSGFCSGELLEGVPAQGEEG